MARRNAIDISLIPGTPQAGQTLVWNAGTERFEFAYPGTGGTVGPVGTIVGYGSNTPPSGWLLCDGSAVSRSQYADLFSAIGTTFGVGDGSTTFNLPDFRGRFALGKSISGTGSTLGGVGGSIDHTHSVPAHFHALGTGADLNITSSGAHTTSLNHDHGAFTSAGESGHTHSIDHDHGSTNTGIQSNDHTHSVSATTGTESADHSHAFSGTTAAGNAKFYRTVANAGTGTNNNHQTGYSGGVFVDATDGNWLGADHTHNYSGNTGGRSAAHTHSFSTTSGGMSANHTHAVDLPNFTGTSGGSSGHTHSIDVPLFSGNSSSTGDHTHATGNFAGRIGLVTGGVDGNAAMTSGSANPPFQVINYIIKHTDANKEIAARGYCEIKDINPVSGFTQEQYGDLQVLTLPSGSNSVGELNFVVPTQPNASDGLTIKVLYALRSAVSGNFKLDLNYNLFDANDNVNPGSFAYSGTQTIALVSGDADLLREATFQIAATTVDDASAPFIFSAELRRDVSVGGNIAADISVIGVYVLGIPGGQIGNVGYSGGDLAITGDEVMYPPSLTSSEAFKRRARKVTTTNASNTNLFTYTLQANSVAGFRVMVQGRYDNTGINKSFWAHVQGGVRRNNAGSAVLVGVPLVVKDHENASTYNVVVAVSGNDLLIQVVGAVGETVDWTGTLEIQEAM